MTHEAVTWARTVIRWPSTDHAVRGDWWIVDDRGTPERAQYEPVSGPYRSERAARAAMRALTPGLPRGA